jgi:hypothetical protein
MNRKASQTAKQILLALLLCILALPASASWKEKVLYSFQGGTDGAYPAGGVVFDKVGNLYGATSSGGANNCPGIAQCGIVYQLKPPTEKGKPWTEIVLYVFKGVNSNDGNTPEGGVILDQAGNVYGTTAYGGSGKCQLFGGRVGCGTVFELIPPKDKGGQWTEKVLHSFQSGKDGYFPWGDLTFDRSGNLYGATQYGGGYGSCNAPYYQHCGTVFKLGPPTVKGGKWTAEVLYAFKSIKAGELLGDGAGPNGGLLVDAKGSIYGTTVYGGYQCPHDNNQGCGTAFMLSSQQGTWRETLLHRFKGPPDGELPSAGLTFGTGGRLYGTTASGGAHHPDEGAIFRLNNSKGSWSENVLDSFDGSGGADPLASLIVDSDGNLYGTASRGGGSSAGAVFKLARPLGQGNWTYTVPYSFGRFPDGGTPQSNLIFDKSGNLYSTTLYGGSGSGCDGHCGAVFELQY